MGGMGVLGALALTASPLLSRFAPRRRSCAATRPLPPLCLSRPAFAALLCNLCYLCYLCYLCERRPAALLPPCRPCRCRPAAALPPP